MRHQTRAHGVELNVAVTPQQIRFGFDQTGAETPIPKRPGTAVSPIDILYIALSQVLHQLRGTLGLLLGHQQMHVIGHEHVGVQPHADTVAEGLQMIEIEEVIVIGKETRGAIIAALDDMYGDTRKVEPGRRGMGVILPRNCSMIITDT